MLTNTGRYLKGLEAPLTALNQELPDAMPENSIYTIDTTHLFAALEGDGGADRRSLDRICKHLQIHTEYLHNAGNDAHVRVLYIRIGRFLTLVLQYTLLAMKSMASGEHVDNQRETRWPNRTAATGVQGPKVQFKPWEEDSDYSDQEGLVPSHFEDQIP